ncbi:ubiquinol-cytochrome c reductase cytochrome b subunit [Angustibacter sp. Root456]|uniref:cytochrome bc1 complex cytochrome b subunit n=1 Tax=Angustibacter sp. Root456 TaxID=1736539 RepID=UPI0006FEF11E|nr:ubiquinol-cytochrome c reductase cytochrome b subunit [Angustibacter sp. Root456]KQX64451.1 ubiquinol-cytochrome c reductase cytochrome b subunit [Angustibacter sp. Root456]
MSQSTANRGIGGVASYVDDRTGAATAVKWGLKKVFPDHWSFMLGEVAMYSLIVLLLTGTFLTFWFVPSAGHVIYDGSYVPLKGIDMSEAYKSTLDISFEVRGGLVMRQIHHWSALLFVASIATHMFRVFFTGAFRKPREINWVIGLVLSLLALVEGFAGYSLPDDLLSGTGLSFARGMILSIPIVGSYVSSFVFGGDYPGEALIPRLYTVHVLLIPALLVVLFTVHIALVALQKHTQYPGPGRTEKNVVGFPVMPVYAAKAGGFFFIVFGVTTLLAAIAEINPIWAYGPYDPSPVTAGSQPDWYMGWLEGAIRLTPGWFEFQVFGWTFSFNIALGGLILPGIVTMAAAFYPFIEAWVTGDKREHHLLDRPRNAPTRTGLGAMAISFYLLLLAGGGNDLIATHFKLSINDITNFLRVAIFVIPPIVFVITKRICLGLQRRDRDLVLHGVESGRIVRLPHGEYLEVHEPVNEYARWELVQHDTHRPLPEPEATDADGVRRPGLRAQRMRAKLSRFWFEDRVETVTPAELAAAHAHGEHEALDTSHESRGIEGGEVETRAVTRH